MLQLNNEQQAVIAAIICRLGLQKQIFHFLSDKLSPGKPVMVIMDPPKSSIFHSGIIVGRQLDGKYLIQLEMGKFCTVSQRMIKLATD